MSARLPNPFLAWTDSTGLPYAGGTLSFYVTNSSTPLNTYSDAALTIANPNPVVLNSAGRPSVAIFLQNLTYKVVLADVNNNQIWTADPVTPSDFASFSVDLTGSGSPNGVVAGTAGSSGVLPTRYWDYTNAILYVCTTTGNAAAAVWTAINQTVVPGVSIPTPQGYLTPTSGTPIIPSDVASATAVFYTPYTGNLVPIYGGASFTPTTFSELTLTLTSSHAINTIYDVFVFSNAGVLTLATGPGWSNSGAGSGARGTGAGTTQISRVQGFYLNAVNIAAAVNGANTYAIAPNRGTYVGSIFIDGTAGQVTCHRAWGSSRKWGIWNAFNRAPVFLKAGDSTANWTYTTATIRESNGGTTNNLTTFSGLAEDTYDLMFSQNISTSQSSAQGQAFIGIGWNSTTAISGQKGNVGLGAGAVASLGGYGNAVATFLQAPSLGINTVSALETSLNTNGTNTYNGAEANMVLSAKWRA